MVDVKNNKYSILWCLMFYLRRISFAAVVICVMNYPAIQLILLLIITVASSVVVLGIKPLPSAWDNKLEFINSSDLIILAYAMYYFTDFAPYPTQRYLMGYFMIFVTVKHIVYNLYFIVEQTISQLKKCLKMKCTKKLK